MLWAGNSVSAARRTAASPGKNFAPEICFDFAFRHCLDQAGDRLSFGTACGSLYVSDDRGETWQTLGNHTTCRRSIPSDSFDQPYLP